MKEVSVFLEKFKNLLLTNKEIKDSVREVFFVVLKTEISYEQIKYKDGVIFIETTPVLKSEILIKKQEILDLINEKVRIKIKNIL